MGDLPTSHWQSLAQGPQRLQQTSLKLMLQTLKKLAAGPYINFFLDKSKISADVLDKSSLKAATTLDQTSVTDVTLPLICLVLTSLPFYRSLAFNSYR